MGAAANHKDKALLDLWREWKMQKSNGSLTKADQLITLMSDIL